MTKALFFSLYLIRSINLYNLRVTFYHIKIVAYLLFEIPSRKQITRNFSHFKSVYILIYFVLNWIYFYNRAINAFENECNITKAV